MGSYNRHLRGDTNEILAPVMGKIVVEAGDLMYLNTNANKAEPFSQCADATAGTARETTLHDNFLGVAMEASLSGTTENISIATTGVFRFPLPADSAVTIGSKISQVSPSLSTSSVSNQKVVNIATASVNGTSNYLGYCVKTQAAATNLFVDFKIHTKTGEGLISAA